MTSKMCQKCISSFIDYFRIPFKCFRIVLLKPETVNSTALLKICQSSRCSFCCCDDKWDIGETWYDPPSEEPLIRCRADFHWKDFERDKIPRGLDFSRWMLFGTDAPPCVNLLASLFLLKAFILLDTCVCVSFFASVHFSHIYWTELLWVSLMNENISLLYSKICSGFQAITFLFYSLFSTLSLSFFLKKIWV